MPNRKNSYGYYMWFCSFQKGVSDDALKKLKSQTGRQTDTKKPQVNSNFPGKFILPGTSPNETVICTLFRTSGIHLRRQVSKGQTFFGAFITNLCLTANKNTKHSCFHQKSYQDKESRLELNLIRSLILPDLKILMFRYLFINICMYV